jgi:hypothetical protein
MPMDLGHGIQLEALNEQKTAFRSGKLFGYLL